MVGCDEFGPDLIGLGEAEVGGEGEGMLPVAAGPAGLIDGVVGAGETVMGAGQLILGLAGLAGAQKDFAEAG